MHNEFLPTETVTIEVRGAPCEFRVRGMTALEDARHQAAAAGRMGDAASDVDKFVVAVELSTAINAACVVAASGSTIPPFPADPERRRAWAEALPVEATVAIASAVQKVGYPKTSAGRSGATSPGSSPHTASGATNAPTKSATSAAARKGSAKG